MAVTTREQQASALGFCCPIPLADGITGIADRQQLIWTYAGVLAGEETEIPVVVTSSASGGSNVTGLGTESWHPVPIPSNWRRQVYEFEAVAEIRLAAECRVESIQTRAGRAKRREERRPTVACQAMARIGLDVSVEMDGVIQRLDVLKKLDEAWILEGL